MTLTGADLDRWRTEQAELARLRQGEVDRLAAQRQQEIQTAVQRGNWEQVANLREADARAAQARAAEAESRAQNYALSSEIAVAMSGYQFVDPAWGPILVERFQRQCQVFPVGTTYNVRHQSGKTVAEFLAEEMRKPMYQGILAANTGGGAPIGDVTGRAGGNQWTVPNTPAAQEVRDWAIRRQQAAVEGGQMFGLRAIG